MNKFFVAVALSFSLVLIGCGGGGSSAQAPAPNPQMSQSEFAQGLPQKTVGQGGNTIAQTASNVVPVTIGSKNLMLVSVTVCRPGTQSCATVDKVMLDTGSVGLRLHASVLQSVLEPASSATIAECGVFGNFYTWGALRQVDIRLGGALASNLPIQLYGDGALPAAESVGCGKSANVQLTESLPSKAGFNGVLGIKGIQADSQSYYSCTSTSCTAFNPSTADKLPNPVARMASDSNGYSIQMPAVPEGGSNTVTGALVLGLGSRPNNSIPATATQIPLNSNQGFQLWLDGAAGTVLVDSGTGVYALPKRQVPSLPTCTGAEPAVYCPASVTSLAILMKASSSPLSVVGTNLTVGNGAAFLSGAMTASSSVATDLPSIVSSFGVDVILGVPFFFGRNIYFSIEGLPVNMGGTVSYQAFVAF